MHCRSEVGRRDQFVDPVPLWHPQKANTPATPVDQVDIDRYDNGRGCPTRPGVRCGAAVGMTPLIQNGRRGCRIKVRDSPPGCRPCRALDATRIMPLVSHAHY